ncbi:PQQ-dependent sugar dehydrogenase [Dyadobacter fanqingshengii]|uniref:PQQ-dependent sugar dehydrogenase n=1 Tax=Dyadobacter fanqingshengii TaxID=2906443 RepID=A0A9X1PFA6_9BACT|nr:PQQ-dependent sugar dehydrogenase [Dyadobacter fanqingshengii]MCF0042823.1 PQQ-dependent sugar dehydrogenase [Dyadobacter fanqingshengii]USJ35958.1 PQQ-dependent sugar dehydrogenase [Dyadobacter fanqingshengii]
MKTTVLIISAAIACLVLSAFFPKPAAKTAGADAPDSTRFTHMMLAQGLDEPMQMAILPNLDVIIVERKGDVKFYDAKEKQVKTIAHINVYSGIEDGLLGVAADPEFDKNHWVYLYYGLAGDRNVSQLTRYDFVDQKLDLNSKKVLLEVPTQRTYCCHSAGYLTFSDGLLYLSTGDNTNAEEIEGHNPTDERPGRQLSDDQGTTANSKDFRGKILRIKPLPDGTYAIPDGNLFPKDGSLGYPEIYVMGCRNPFRVSVDPKTKFVYWGDVGPDTNVPAEEGFLSYDEINQARKPGFFGYPYFLGANEAFPKYDFETKKEGPKQDPAHPVNNSPNNTGIKELPPAQPAMIWYGKGDSKRWPMVGKGAASAMAGPVYYSDLYPNAKYKLPEYYNGKLFIYEWIRKWIMAVTLDKDGNYVSMEPFLPHLKVIAPMDMQIAHDGAIYMLAYGTNWFAKNTDAGLIRVEYSEGNRNPIANIQADKTIGAAPLTVTLSASQSKDYDKNDKLTFNWKVADQNFTGANVKHTFTKPGVYNVALTVSDQAGGSGVATAQIKVGNSPPDVTISTAANRSFYWDNVPFDYKVVVKDAEDKTPDQKNITLAFDYLPIGKDFAAALSGANHGNLRYAATETFYASLDCKSCHTMDSKSIGPALKEISKRYAAKTGAADLLSDKIIKGGSGNWGTYPMPPHPNLTTAQSRELAGYILSLTGEKATLATQGNIQLVEHLGQGNEGAYVLAANYTDKGANGIEPLKGSAFVVLKNPLVQLEDFEKGNVSVSIGTKNNGFVTSVPAGNGKFVSFANIDLNHIKKIKFRILEDGEGGTLEIRQGSVEGTVLGSLNIAGGKSKDIKPEWKEMRADVKPFNKQTDIFFVFNNPDKSKKMLFYVDWMYFER